MLTHLRINTSYKNYRTYVNLLKSVKQEFHYSIKLCLFADGIIVKQLKIVLLPFHHYCHGPATQARFRGLHSSHPLDVVYLQYQQH